MIRAKGRFNTTNELQNELYFRSVGLGFNDIENAKFCQVSTSTATKVLTAFEPTQAQMLEALIAKESRLAKAGHNTSDIKKQIKELK